MKNVLCLGDLHCGHRVGLTPPRFQSKSGRMAEYGKVQAEYWRKYQSYLATFLTYGSVDVLIVNGDCIDGTGFRSGGLEQITPDLDEQCEMAVEIIQGIGAKEVYLTYGTPYHVCNNGSQEELKIAQAVGGSMHGHLQLKVDDVMFDVKHKIGSSGIPHGRCSALMKAILWNQRCSQEGTQERADVLLRSHVHYHAYCGDAKTLGMTLPALQGSGSKFGEEQCEGIVDFGLAWFGVDGQDYSWEVLCSQG